MTMKTKIRKIGNSYGILLPKAALEAMKVREGDVVYMTEAPEDALHLTAGDREFSDIMAIAERGMRRYRNALRELAK